MAPIQNTFSIIPNAPSAIPGESRPSRPPMTSKQAKKAYRESNKAPKLSKAERRRQELFEQDRIRREFEKERNQARARAARDKKKEKEEQERAERKKKGLPLVAVRASQDTIARFVRPNVKTKKPSEQPSKESPGAQSNEDNSPEPPTTSAERKDPHRCASSSAEENPEPPAKRQRLNRPLQDEMDKGSSPSSSKPRSQREVDEVTIPPVPVNPTEKAGGASEKSSSTTEHIDEQLPTELIESTRDPYEEQGGGQHKEIKIPRDSDIPVEPPPAKPSRPSCPEIEASKSLARTELAARDNARSIPTPRPLQDISINEVNARAIKPPPDATLGQGKQVIAQQPLTTPPVQILRKSQTSAPTPQAFRYPKTSMPPPPIPPKFKVPKPAPVSGPRTPQFLKPISKPQTATKSGQHFITPSGQEELPPTSTQLFMFNHLDDFFPSPSQEVRELFEEPKIGPTQKHLQVKQKPNHTPTTVPPFGQRLPIHRVSTTAMRPEKQVAPGAQISPKSNRVKEHTSSGPPKNPSIPAVIRLPNNPDAFDIPIFSTQDICLSSQDMKDIEDGSSSSLPRDQTIITSNGSRNTLRSSETASHAAAKFNAPTRCITKSVEDSSPINHESPNLGLPTKLRSDHNRSASSRFSSEHVQPSYSSITKRPSVPSQQTKSATDYKTFINSKHISIRPVGGQSLTSKRLGGVQNAEIVSPQVLASGIGQVQHQLNIDNSTAVPHPSPKPFLASTSRHMRYKYAVERSRTSAWEDARARRQAQEELDQLQIPEDERLIELLASAGEEDDKPDKGGQTDGPDAIMNGPADRASSQAQRQRRLPAANQSSISGLKRMTSDVTKERDEKCRVQNRPRNSYDQMLELLKQAQSSDEQPQKQNIQRAASPETDYEDAWDDDLCDIL
ncbi:hypothetical protein F5X99DRAFT_375591 [Biscogniauxia marginata]|nr:hypothetical protein F5X99DRAFT_375591 [Biscogniauxia marginata]